VDGRWIFGIERPEFSTPVHARQRYSPIVKPATACILATILSAAAVACGGDEDQQRIEVQGYVSTLAGGPQDMYVGHYSGAVERRDGDDGELLATRTVDGDIDGIAVTIDAVFVTVQSDNLVLRLNAMTLDEEARAEIASVDGMVTAVGPIAATDEAVVVGDFDNVIVLDPTSLEQLGRTDDLDGIVRAVAVDGDAAYGATGNGLLYQFDAQTAAVVERRDVEYGPVDECGLAAVTDGVWLAGTRAAGHYASGTLEPLADVALDDSLAVVADERDGALIRGATGGVSELLVVATDGAIVRRVDAEDGECLARAGDSDTAWGRAFGGLVKVDVD